MHDNILRIIREMNCSNDYHSNQHEPMDVRDPQLFLTVASGFDREET